MANILRIELREEKDYIVKDNTISFLKQSIGYNVYASIDELTCWIGSCCNLDALEEIVGPEELITSIRESASEYELTALMSALECNKMKYDFFGQIRTAKEIR